LHDSLSCSDEPNGTAKSVFGDTFASLTSDPLILQMRRFILVRIFGTIELGQVTLWSKFDKLDKQSGYGALKDADRMLKFQMIRQLK
jgi:hypothetical protein